MTTDALVIDYIDVWPLTCVHCGSTQVFYSAYANDCKCQVCEKWQLNEENNNEKNHS